MKEAEIAKYSETGNIGSPAACIHEEKTPEQLGQRDSWDKRAGQGCRYSQPKEVSRGCLAGIKLIWPTYESSTGKISPRPLG
jgi:hypothetical protein